MGLVSLPQASRPSSNVPSGFRSVEAEYPCGDSAHCPAEPDGRVLLLPALQPDRENLPDTATPVPSWNGALGRCPWLHIPAPAYKLHTRVKLWESSQLIVSPTGSVCTHSRAGPPREQATEYESNAQKTSLST